MGYMYTSTCTLTCISNIILSRNPQVRKPPQHTKHSRYADRRTDNMHTPAQIHTPNPIPQLTCRKQQKEFTPRESSYKTQRTLNLFKGQTCQQIIHIWSGKVRGKQLSPDMKRTGVFWTFLWGIQGYHMELKQVGSYGGGLDNLYR